MIWRWLLSGVLVIAAALVVAVALLFGTEPGARWLAREAGVLSAGAVRLEGVTGTLNEGLRVDSLDIVAGEVKLRLEGVELVMRPAALWSGRLFVRRLAASRVVLHLGPARPDEPFVMPTIATPIPLRVRQLQVGTLEVHRDEAAWTVTGLRLAGRLRGSLLEVSGGHAEFAGLVVQLDGSAGLRPPLPLDARVGWSLPAAALSGAGTAKGDLDELAVAQALRLPEPATLRATLRDLAGAPRVAAEARWAALARAFPGVGKLEARDGSATLEGTPGDWRATLATALQGDLVPPLQATARAHGDAGRVVLEQVRGAGAFGAVAARGVVAFGAPAAGPRLRLDIIARDVDAAAFRAGLEGRLSGRARLALAPDAPTRLDLVDLDGQLMGRPLAGSGSLALQDGTLTFSKLALRAGPNRLRADGSVGDRLAGRFDLEAPDLAVLWPALSGSLAAQATLAGTRARPVLDVTARASALALGDSHVAHAELRARVDRSRRADLALVARGIRAGEYQAGDLEATLAGTLDDHHLQAALGGGAVAVVLSSAGRWDGTALRHHLAAASVSADAIGTWRLAGEPALALSATAVDLGDHCWEQAPTALCVSNAHWRPGQGGLSAELRDLDLARFDRWLGRWVGEDLAVAGRAAATLAVALAPAGVSGTLRWRQQGTTLYYTGGDEPLVTALPTVEVDADLVPGEGRLRLELAGESGLHLSGRARMQAPLGADAPLQADIAGGLPDIAPLVPLLAGDVDLSEVSGRVTLDAAATGTLRAPRLTGSVRLVDGAMALPDIGVKLEAINLALTGDGGETLRLDGGAMAGGPLDIDGELRPLAPGGPRGWVRIRGNRVDAVRLPDRYVQASPDLRLDYAPGALTASGRIVIPQADIVVRELPESAASPSRDAVVRDRPPRADDTAIRTAIAGEVEIELGRKVHLQGFGLDTLLEGTLKISQAPDRSPRGYGVVRLKEGRFGAYGKELVIERGTLGFAGPLDDPAVDIRASRRVDYEGRSVTAGIQLSGTASRPQSSVFSDPAMSQADAISYLISGKPMQGSSESDQSAVAGAALALGVQQTSPLTQAIGTAVTLDELGVEGGALNETQVVAGKQLGSDLYVRFSYGLFNRIGTVLARYRLNRSLSIEAASGEDQSLDLVYSIERN